MAIAFDSATTLLLVYDVPTAIAFYRDILGFEVVSASQPFDDAKDNYGWAMLRKNYVQLMLNNMYEDNIRPSKPDALRTQHHSDTTIYMDCADVEDAYMYLLSKGLAARPPVNTYYGMRQVHVCDPDGYSLVFQRAVDGK